MFIGGGRDHRVENNMFVDCDPAVRVDGRGLDKSPVWHNMVDDTCASGSPKCRWRCTASAIRRLPTLDRVLCDKPTACRPRTTSSPATSASANGWRSAGTRTQDMLKLEETTSAPIRASSRQTRWISGSRPIRRSWPLGFKPIPFEQIGLRPGRGLGCSSPRPVIGGHSFYPASPRRRWHCSATVRWPQSSDSSWRYSLPSVKAVTALASSYPR